MLHFLFVCGHLLTGSPIGYGDLFAPQPQTGSGGIDGDIAAAYDHDLFAGCMPVSQGNILQQFHRIDDLRKVIFSRNVQLVGLVGADGE